MSITRKGDGYSEVETIRQAIATAGCSLERFFEVAKKHSNTNHFDPAAAAKAYRDSNGEKYPQAARQLADWVETHSDSQIKEKFRSVEIDYRGQKRKNRRFAFA